VSKILVTGGLGFVGSNLVDALIQGGDDVTIIDNLSSGKLENLNPEAKFNKADITHKYIWDILTKFDYVFHTAALARIQPSIKDPLPGHDANVNGTLNVLEYCRRTRAKLIFSSSSSIYQGNKLPTREQDPKYSKNPYALQKYICEQYIELYAQLYGLDYVILRYFNVFGKRQLTEGAYATALGIFLKQKAEGKPMTITNDGEQRRDFTYIDDVVKANIMAMDWKGTFNIGAGNNYSINEIADLIGGERGYIGARLGEVRETLADNSKARQKGWYPTPNALEDFING
jgi:UDP-glucose 4-epimerase